LKVRINGILILINLLTILLVIAIVYSTDVPRIILGLPFVLFFPGYTLMLALFPKRSQMEGVERIALSFGLSIAIVPLLGLVLNYTPWGIRLTPILCTVASFTFVMSAIGWVRTRKLPDDENPRLELHFRRPTSSVTAWDKVLAAILVVAILGAVGTAGYLMVNPKVGQNFTEFYLLGQEGKLGGYPKQFAVGEAGKITVGIVNHEHQPFSYHVTALIGGEESDTIGPVLLQDGEKWEGEITFTPKVPGDNQKVEFLLFKGNENQPSLDPLRLWINVKE
jgi:uncharacterized membrane protein